MGHFALTGTRLGIENLVELLIKKLDRPFFFIS